MNTSLSSAAESPEHRGIREDCPARLDKLRQLIEDKVHLLDAPITEECQGLVCEANTGGLWRFALLSEELTFHLQQLQRQTEQELHNICTQLFHIEGREQLLSSELFNLKEKKKQAAQELWTDPSLQTSAFHLCAGRELQVSITERLLQSERLVFQKEALSALRNLLTQDLQRYQEETQRLTCFTQKVRTQKHRLERGETFTSREKNHNMQGKTETEQGNNMYSPKSSAPKVAHSPFMSLINNETKQVRKASQKPSAVLARSTDLRRAGSIKDLIHRFSTSDSGSAPGSPQSPSCGSPKSVFADVPESPKTKLSLAKQNSFGKDKSSVPSITLTPPMKLTSQNLTESTQKSDQMILIEPETTHKSNLTNLNLVESTKKADQARKNWAESTQKRIHTSENLDEQTLKSNQTSLIGAETTQKSSLINPIGVDLNKNGDQISQNLAESTQKSYLTDLIGVDLTKKGDETDLIVIETTKKVDQINLTGDESTKNSSFTNLMGLESTQKSNLNDLIGVEFSNKGDQTNLIDTEWTPQSNINTLNGAESTQKRSQSSLIEDVSTQKINQTSQNEAESAPKGNQTGHVTARIDCPVEGSAQRTEAEVKSKTQTTDSGRESVADSGMGSESELDTNKQPESPSEEEPTTPRPTSTSQSPKYQLFLNNEMKTNGLGMFDGPTRPFMSPYSNSMDYNSTNRMSEFKPRLSPATSELNLYSINSRSTSPVGLQTPTLNSPRPRISAYDSLFKRRSEINSPIPQTHYSTRSATMASPNRKDYIEELTKQLNACQKRNQFLEAESVEMDKERNQIRFEMRNLLVNNEDLHRTNTQLNNEMKRLREQMIEVDREKQAIAENFRQMEIEVKQAREVMVEANNQEYAFNYLQQSLENKLKDAEENLEKETQRSQTISERLWMVERQLEELELDKGTKDKKTSELNSTIMRLETELSEAQLASSQAATELNLQQKLRDDAQMRVEELEECLLEKDQEVQKLQAIVNRLQGEVSGKLIDKERTLEEEIQLRERIQLQCKQAERMVDDLQMELHTANQAKEDFAKQCKVAKEKMIDLESDLEELHDCEQRWAAKHKRAIEQVEQLQLKLIQGKDQNDMLEADKASMERQLREMRLEVEDLQSSRVQEDVISRAESRVKELENTLRNEERNKSVLTNTISKLERRINELGDQMEEEHRIANEQKDLMTQRMRSLKRQLNEAEEEAGRKEAQYRSTQRELAEERETSGRLQRQLLDQHIQSKRMDTMSIRQTLDNLRLDLSVDDEDEDLPTEEQKSQISKV